MTKHQLELPFVRRELISHMESLSDPQEQQSLWVEDKPYKNFMYGSFDTVIDFLYREYDLADIPYDFIGEVLVDKNEAYLLKELDKTLDILFERYGGKLSDAEYITKPEWQDVVAAARRLLDKLNTTPVEGL
ncbi:hypothetical protein FZC33_18700 [Labrys sp. KNU-23]|uniref:SCO4402 family protein n=1 Tax=Labrys sp. KNU-23 TaxID=2789216 RepID=UPI0011EF71F0|nr:hypothetical protein [Labrys sp. KNU-23]QEN88207.1 hypothetical protein FZC33_18700 [Labrys sp. KNU-23]